jgi:pimeloyl-ACP methyl ester carboxylesterase
MARPKPTFFRDGLAIYAFGAGVPLLLMPYPHGASVVGDLTPTALIDGLVPLGRHVITFDPPGAGRSTRPLRLGMAEMLDCAEEALAICGVPGAVDVFGHSQGALAALAFAIERPWRVRRLILVGAAAGGPSYLQAPGAIWNHSHPAFWRFGPLALLLQLTRRYAAQQMMLNAVTRASYADPTCAPHRPVRPRDWLLPAEPRIWWANVARYLDYRDRLAAVAAPTLVVVGRYDPQTPVACAEELAAGLPHASLRRFEGSGHYPFIEEPEQFWAEVQAFLQAPVDHVRNDDLPDGNARH